MGHSSKKSNQSLPANQALDLNALGQIMQNIDVSAMANMLNGIDMNQVMSMLSGVVPQPGQQNTSEAEVSKEAQVLRDIPFPEPPSPVEPVNPGPNALNPQLPPNDPIVIILNSLKPFLPQEKCKVIDDMIMLLGIKTVIDSVFPARTNK
jgi:hypothetical protein